MNFWNIIWSTEIIILILTYALGIGITELLFRRIDAKYGDGFCGEGFIAIFSALWPIFWLIAFIVYFIENKQNNNRGN